MLLALVQDQWETERKVEGTPLTVFFSKWKQLRQQHEARDLQKNGNRNKRKIDSDEEGDDEPEDTGEGGGVNDAEVTPATTAATSSRQQRKGKAPQERKGKTRRKQRKASRTTREKERIRGILANSTGGQEFQLSGMQLSDDEDK